MCGEGWGSEGLSFHRVTHQARARVVGPSGFARRKRLVDPPCRPRSVPQTQIRPADPALILFQEHLCLTVFPELIPSQLFLSPWSRESSAECSPLHYTLPDLPLVSLSPVCSDSGRRKSHPTTVLSGPDSSLLPLTSSFPSMTSPSTVPDVIIYCP